LPKIPACEWRWSRAAVGMDVWTEQSGWLVRYWSSSRACSTGAPCVVDWIAERRCRTPDHCWRSRLESRNTRGLASLARHRSHERGICPRLHQNRPARIRTWCNGTNVCKSKCIWALLKLLFKIKIRMSHTRVVVQTPTLLCELCLRCDWGRSESCSRPKAFRIHALPAHPPTLLLTSAFDISSSSHRNSARHMEKFVSSEKRVCMFKCNDRNVQSIDAERTYLTSQIFVVADFAKHRAGKRRLYLRHCGNVEQCSHGSDETATTPQLEHVILARCGLGHISENNRTKVLTLISHYFRVRLLSYYILLSWKFYINSNKKNLQTRVRAGWQDLIWR